MHRFSAEEYALAPDLGELENGLDFKVFFSPKQFRDSMSAIL